LTQGITSGRLARIAIPATGRDGGARRTCPCCGLSFFT
jgi:hypothetical protein